MFNKSTRSIILLTTLTAVGLFAYTIDEQKITTENKHTSIVDKKKG